MNPHETHGDDSAFEREVLRHRRTLFWLVGAFVAYYFALVLGAAYFQEFFATRVFGRVNVGLLFALSQYVFGGLVAWAYVARMRITDAVMGSLKV